MRRIVIIPKDDLILYPPTLSLIQVLVKLGRDVICVGEYSDIDRKRVLEESGVSFIPVFRKTKDVSKIRVINWIVIFLRMKQYQRKIKQVLQSPLISKDDLIWYIYTNSIGYIQKYIEKYKYIIQFYEFEDYSLGGKEKWLHPNYDVHRFFAGAQSLVHCEYNRAMITSGLYGITKKPTILPNKPYEINEPQIEDLPYDIKELVDNIRTRIVGKKVIIYQGIFDSSERRLNEFCEAMQFLTTDYVFVAMGGGGEYYNEIKTKYESERVIFLPFVRPPYHLLITKMASYGVLTYHPANHSYIGVINPLYCAPNKIFEFGKYGIPMIANDVPGLKLIFESYKCGKTVPMPLTPNSIAETILSIDKVYDVMSKGSRSYYDSVNVETIVKSIIEC